MFLSRALGAALLAVPLAGAAGQSASGHPASDPAADSGGSHRFAWIASTGVASAAVFTTFVHLSNHGAAGAPVGPVTPGTPVPNRYTDASLPGDGIVSNQPPPSHADSNSQESGVAGDTDSGTDTSGLIDIAIPPDPLFDAPPDTTSTDMNSSGDPSGGTQDPPSYQPPPGPHMALAVVVTTPEPETLSLLGTGLVGLIPLVRRRRSTG